VDIVTIDWETFYDQDYSLSKITTEEYIRSDFFEPIGVSVKINNEPGVWYSGNDFHTFINSLDYSDKAILCHHTAFDGAILSWQYDIKPRLWLDTLSMSRPQYAVTVGGSLKMLAAYHGAGCKGTEVDDAKGKHRKDFTPSQLTRYGNYCINDGDLTFKLFKKLSPGFPPSEIMVIDQIIRMYTEPVFELDRYALQEHLEEVQAKKAKLLAKLGNGDPEKAKSFLMSNNKFAMLLASLGVTVPMKISPRTGKETFAFAKTDQGMKDLQHHDHPAVAALVEARLGVKSTIEETRTQRLIDVSERGPLPVMLTYYAAHTGRFGGGDKLNLQNLPARKSKAIRRTICAPDGYKIVAADSSQIEARILAVVAKQHDLTEAFRLGQDVYSEFASDIYGYKIDRKNNPEHTKEGFVGKTCILGLGYGMGPPKFLDTVANGDVDVDIVEATRIVYLYRTKYAAIKGLWGECARVLTAMANGQSGTIRDFLPYTPDGIELPNGLMIQYNGLMPETNENIRGGLPYGFKYIGNNRQFRKLTRHLVADTEEENIYTNIYGGKVVENIVQALARIVVSEQMTTLRERGFPVALQVHDENVMCVLDPMVGVAKQVAQEVMSTPPTWLPQLPVACEVGSGETYGDCK